MGLFKRFFASSISDLKDIAFYKALLGELLGVLILVFVSCSSPYGEHKEVGVDQTRISLTFGFSVATLVWILANVSGGHINPAVSAGMFVTRKISLVRFILYVVSQLIGAVIGSAIQKFLTCDWQLSYKRLQQINSTVCELGMTKLGKGLNPVQGFGIELIITFVLVATVFATCDRSRKDLNGSGPLAIGLSVAMCHLAFNPLTGVSMNTARSFGPAVIRGNFENQWVYWCGPILGGVLAGLLYEFLFAGDAKVGKLTAWLLNSEYESVALESPSSSNWELKEADDTQRSQRQNGEKLEQI